MLHADLLLIACDYIERNVKAKNFDITCYISKPPDQNNCGTVGCFLGHAGLLPVWRAAGFETRCDRRGSRIYTRMPGKKNFHFTNIASIATFFDVPIADLESLFFWFYVNDDPFRRQRTRMDVVRDVRRYVVAKQKKTCAAHHTPTAHNELQEEGRESTEEEDIDSV